MLITTKLGKKGKPVIGYNYTYGSSQLRKKLDVMNAADYARTVNADVLTRTGDGAIPVPIFTNAEIADYEKRAVRIGRMLFIVLLLYITMNFP